MQALLVEMNEAAVISMDNKLSMQQVMPPLIDSHKNRQIFFLTH
jgi:hypothetical protein